MKKAEASGDDLHRRIAKALDWPLRGAQSFSLITLRTLLKPHHPKLVAEINRRLRTGSHIIGEHLEEP